LAYESISMRALAVPELPDWLKVTHNWKDAKIVPILERLRQLDGKADEGSFEKAPAIDVRGSRLFASGCGRAWRARRRPRNLQRRRRRLSRESTWSQPRAPPPPIRTAPCSQKLAAPATVSRGTFGFHLSLSLANRSSASAAPSSRARSYHLRASSGSGAIPCTCKVESSAGS
jgi:hypothetical protein